ncbi:MAG: hypothetical protein HYW47_06010 [Deltaproteobacteria bacterium]|nr:hypothetical protein [Deltaproteobacteria bacterium]
MLRKLLKILFVGVALYAIAIMPIGRDRKLYQVLPLQEARFMIFNMREWIENTWNELSEKWFENSVETN